MIELILEDIYIFQYRVTNFNKKPLYLVYIIISKPHS